MFVTLEDAALCGPIVQRLFLHQFPSGVALDEELETLPHQWAQNLLKIVRERRNGSNR